MGQALLLQMAASLLKLRKSAARLQVVGRPLEAVELGLFCRHCHSIKACCVIALMRPLLNKTDELRMIALNKD